MPEIDVMAISSPIDRYQLAIYCCSVARYREVETLFSVRTVAPGRERDSQRRRQGDDPRESLLTT